MNSDATFYVQSCQGPNIPEIVLRSVEENHKVKFIFELNKDCIAKSISFGPILTSNYYVLLKGSQMLGRHMCIPANMAG